MHILIIEFQIIKNKPKEVKESSGFIIIVSNSHFTSLFYFFENNSKI